MTGIFFHMRRYLLAALVGTISTTALVSSPAGANTVFVDEPFGPSWTAGSDWIVGTGSTYTPQIVTDNAFSPTSALRLTDTGVNRSSALIYRHPQPTSQGLDVSFRLSQWGGTGADGMTFFLQKGTETSSLPGSLGGALGYSTEPGHNPPKEGLPSALLGIGFDRFGNFSSSTFGGASCGDGAPATTANSLVVRGPGNGFTGYCRLAIATNSVTNWTTGADTRLGRARSIRIIVDPSTASTPKVRIWICAVETVCDTSTSETLMVNAPTELINEPTIRFGFAAGTGGLTNLHELWDLKVGSQTTFPAVDITTTSLPNATPNSAYSQTLAASGVAPITFVLVSGSLPTGLSLNTSTGEISGTPTGSGTSNFTIEATDSRAQGQNGRTTSRAYTLTVTSSSSPTTTVSSTATTTAIVKATRELPATGNDTNTSLYVVAVMIMGGAALVALTGTRRRKS